MLDPVSVYIGLGISNMGYVVRIELGQHGWHGWFYIGPAFVDMIVLHITRSNV